MDTANTGIVNLTDSEFQELVDIIYENTRIKMGEHKRTLVASRLSKRLRMHKLATFSEYIKFIKDDKNDDEIVDFINAVTTNKTDFFRENKHFEFMKMYFCHSGKKILLLVKIKILGYGVQVVLLVKNHIQLL